MFDTEFSADEFVRAGIECLALANNKGIAEKVKSSCHDLASTAGEVFGDRVMQLALNPSILKPIFRISLRIDILKVTGLDHEAISSGNEGKYIVRIRHVESGKTAISVATRRPIWKQAFIVGPVNFQDCITFSVIWRPETQRLVQLCCQRVLGIINLPVSNIPSENFAMGRYQLEDSNGAYLEAHIRLWREPKRAYISHVIVILTLLKDPVRLVNKLSWDSIWTVQEAALLRAHSFGLSRTATLTAQLHALSIASSKIPPNFLLVFEILSKLRIMPTPDDRLIDLCRKLNQNIREHLNCRKYPIRCLTAYDQTQLVGLLGCCALIEDFDLIISKEQFKQFVIAEINLYFDEWMHRLTSTGDQYEQFLKHLQSMIMDFHRLYGPVNDVVRAAWGERITDFLSEAAKRFIPLFRDVSARLEADQSFDLYRVVVTFCSHFHVKLNLEDCFSTTTVLLWFRKLSDNHKRWISKIVASDDFLPIAENVFISSGFRNFRDLIHHRLCSIFRSFLAKPPLVINCFAQTLCICCWYYCKQTHKILIREKFFSKMDGPAMSIRFSMALNNISECYDMLLRETVSIKENCQGEVTTEGSKLMADSPIAVTKTKLEGKTREVIEGFLTRLSVHLRQLMQKIANSKAIRDIGSHAMDLSEFLDKLLGVLCQNVNRMLFSIVLETLFRCCVDVLGSVAGEYQPWSPWNQRRDPKALVECARLIRECFCSSESGRGLPPEKVNTPEFLWLESKLQSLVNS